MIALALSLVVSAAPAPPVAVMPFKDLSGDPGLAWLSAGIAETMIVDLRKGSNVPVVERAQLQHALAELALQGEKGVEEATAARVGKMVGARTVVVGSYQRADKELRIVARFVDVETGVVKDAAKVTGPLSKIFELQDQIVVALAGAPVREASRHKHSSGSAAANPESSVRAYKAFAQSLSVMSDVDRLPLLEAALKEDPDFSYAEDQLGDLKERMKREEKVHQQALDAKIHAGRMALADATLTPEVRQQKATELLGDEMAARRYHAVLADSATVLAPAFPDGVSKVKAIALYYRFVAYSTLNERSLAIQVGEHFITAYPDSIFYSGAEASLSRLVTEQADALEKARSFEADLRAVEEANEKARAARTKSLPNVDWSEAMARCRIMIDHQQYPRAGSCLREMIRHPVANVTPDLRWVAWAQLVYVDRDGGDFDAAYRDLAAFTDFDPKNAAIPNQAAKWWPAD